MTGDTSGTLGMSVVTTISQEPTSDPFSAMDLPHHGLFVMTTESYDRFDI